MIPEYFVFVGFFISAIGGLSYLVQTLQGKVQPNRVSWMLWAASPLIAFFAEVKQGVGVQSWMTFSVGFFPLLVFIASFFTRKSVWKIQKIDYLCGALSVVGLILWMITKVGNVAIFFSILADGLAAVPTIIKSYQKPESESYLAYLCGSVNGLITLLTITHWDFAHYGFPSYILLINLLLTLLIILKIGKKIH